MRILLDSETKGHTFFSIKGNALITRDLHAERVPHREKLLLLYKYLFFQTILSILVLLSPLMAATWYMSRNVFFFFLHQHTLLSQQRVCRKQVHLFNIIICFHFL